MPRLDVKHGAWRQTGTMSLSACPRPRGTLTAGLPQSILTAATASPFLYCRRSAIALPLRHAVSAASFKITATTAACRIRQNSSLPLFAVRLAVPESTERMNGVNDPGHTKRSHVKDLGVAINLSHGGGAVSDFARNIVGNTETFLAVDSARRYFVGSRCQLGFQAKSGCQRPGNAFAQRGTKGSHGGKP